MTKKILAIDENYVDSKDLGISLLMLENIFWSIFQGMGESSLDYKESYFRYSI